MTNRFIERLGRYTALTMADVQALRHVTATVTSVRPRIDLIRKGDPVGPIFVMLDGWALRYMILPDGSRQIVGIVLPGDACDLRGGAWARMDHSIQTVGRAQVARIERDAMDALVAAHPAAARAMEIARLVEEATLRAWIVNLGRRSSTERIAHLMLEVVRRTLPSGADNPAIELPLSQVILADALGLTPVHINRVLQDLRRSGAIELGRGVLRIQDVDALADLCGFDGDYLHPRSD